VILADKQAEAKAQALLKSVIGAQAYRQYVRDGYFDLIGSDQRTYRIMRNGISSNVYELNETGTWRDWQGQLQTGGQITRTFCIHLPFFRNPDRWMEYAYAPVADHHLAQVLMLLTDAAKFRQIAY
jgi:hypothetical protein